MPRISEIDEMKMNALRRTGRILPRRWSSALPAARGSCPNANNNTTAPGACRGPLLLVQIEQSDYFAAGLVIGAPQTSHLPSAVPCCTPAQ